ncbi:MAG: cob(I)yrinic acid a,c-diamide adenosyltransferase [Chloroflexota bacterium]|nr:MAG: propanediol utilization protein [Bellilinea sp.]
MKATIYTGIGDTGQTRLLGNVTINKDDLRVEVYGTLDEATSTLGLARATTLFPDLHQQIWQLQEELIPVMSEIAAVPGVVLKKPIPQVSAEQVRQMENWIDRWSAEWIQTGHFITPGGSQASAALDMARTVVRRAERRLVSLHQREPVNPYLLKYLNRLSDLLYVLARVDEQRTLKNIIREVIEGGPSPDGKRDDPSGTLTLEDSQRMITAGIRRATEIGVPMVLSVADEQGQIIQTCRMDGARPISIQLAPHKAYTAAAVRVPTHELAHLSQPGQPLYHIDANVEKLTVVGGGFPVIWEERVIGGVGVSGGSVEQDMEVAQAMLAAFEEV